jgi:hypothetical protein
MGGPDARALALLVCPKAAFMKYSITFKFADGRTERSEYLAFDSDADAVGYIETNGSSSAITEVWKGDNLLKRLQSPKPAS